MSSHKSRKQKGQEGVVLLIVLLILLMATSTAMYAMRSMTEEQRSVRLWVEALETRSVGESATWMGIGELKMDPAQEANRATDTRWMTPNGFAERYGMPLLPDARNVRQPLNTVDGTLDVAALPVFQNTLAFPHGAAAFMPTLVGVTSGPKAGRRVEYRYMKVGYGVLGGWQRFVVTGFGETGVWSDPTETTWQGRRGANTKIAVARGYVDASGFTRK